MANPTDQLGIYVDISKDIVPRLNFTLGGHTTNVDIDSAGASELAGSLLMSSFICSIGKSLPEGTPISPGQLPVASVEGQVDAATNLPTLVLTLIGGAKLTFVMSADLAAQGSITLLTQVRAVTPLEPADEGSDKPKLQ